MRLTTRAYIYIYFSSIIIKIVNLIKKFKTLFFRLNETIRKGGFCDLTIVKIVVSGWLVFNAFVYDKY